MWVGAQQHALHLFSRKKKLLYHIRNGETSSLWLDYIGGIFEDKAGSLWIRNTAGINTIEIKKGKSLSLLQQEGNLLNQYTLLFSHIVLDSTIETGKKNMGRRI